MPRRDRIACREESGAWVLEMNLMCYQIHLFIAGHHKWYFQMIRKEF